jgi:hypothetical protein
MRRDSDCLDLPLSAHLLVTLSGRSEQGVNNDAVVADRSLIANPKDRYAEIEKQT